MKTLRVLMTSLLLVVAGQGAAQTDISGTWSGDLAAGPGTTIEIHFDISRDGDGYSTTLTSPDQSAIQNLPATSTSFDGSRLVMVVDALSGRYEGTLQDGVFSGSWHQLDTAIPLDLAPFVERVLTEADKDMLRGSWVGDLTVQGVTLAIVFRFEDDASGEFVGFLDSPDQGATGIAVAGIEVDNGRVSFDIPQISGEYTATLAGENLQGTFTQFGMPMPLNVARGQYVSRGLELSPEAFERLEGSWVGNVASPAGGNVPIVFRFEATDDGGVAAFLDSPEQGATGIPASEVAVENDQFSIVIPAAQASYTATLSADEMVGTWAQGNFSVAVTMSRGPYVPAATPLELSDQAYERLEGVWNGQWVEGEGARSSFTIRFETTGDGARVGYLDVEAQRIDGMRIAEATLDGDSLTFVIPTISTTVTTTLDGDAMQGNWQQGPTASAIMLVREP